MLFQPLLPMFMVTDTYSGLLIEAQKVGLPLGSGVLSY
jgi:hypothetical protein